MQCDHIPVSKMAERFRKKGTLLFVVTDGRSTIEGDVDWYRSPFPNLTALYAKGLLESRHGLTCRIEHQNGSGRWMLLA